MTVTSNQKLKLLHVVRRYGPVGGMERYVWELTRELAALGHQVVVVCERCHVEKPENIAVHELGEIAARPRWLALLRFGLRVARWLQQNPQPDSLIHSHERLRSHHLTTFHGPPFATIFERQFWRLFSVRVWMQLYLERRELSVARYIVPNSQFIKQQLAHYYPQWAHKLTAPIVPGVLPGVQRAARAVPREGGVVGFVGREWQRKGLPFALNIVAILRRTRPDLQFCVVGPAVAEVQHLFADSRGGYQLLGWSNQTHYADFDVLLHPARAEPYGMVISEAMAASVPVVISDVCGAALHVTPAAGAVLPLTAPLAAWVNAMEKQLRRSDAPPQFVRGWNEVARDYETIYRQYSEGEKR